MIPNDYLFEHHANKGDDRWEIYAWAVREAMSIASGLDKNEQPFRDKMHYEVVLGFKKDRAQSMSKTEKKGGSSSSDKPEKEPLLNNRDNEEFRGIN
jgi:hypothetical protein